MAFDVGFMASDFGLTDTAHVLFQPQGTTHTLLSLIPEETWRYFGPSNQVSAEWSQKPSCTLCSALTLLLSKKGATV